VSSEDRGKLDAAITGVYVRFVRVPPAVFLCFAAACASSQAVPDAAIPDECATADPPAHRTLAIELSGSGDVEGAIRHYRCALALDPTIPATRIELAAELLNASAYADAHAELLQIERRDVRARTLMAAALEGLGKLRAAADELARAADETGTSAVLYRRAAALYLRAGDEERAGVLLTRADELDPPPEQREMRQLREARPPRKKKRRR
jgi:tetratricopeptide (TPR) repeat protein